MTQDITLVDIATGLDALQEADFDMMRVQSDGMERLRAICNAIEGKFMASEVAPLLFRFMERLEHCDLGSPGPVVHTLEALPSYAMHLTESVLRKPTALTVWMVSRLANAEGPECAEWLALLRSVRSSPLASEEVRKEAAECLEFQNAA